MKLDILMVAGLARTVETLSAKALQYDPGTRNSIKGLSGRVLAIEVTQPQFTLYLTVEQDRIRLPLAVDVVPEAMLRGALTDLIALMGRDSFSLANSGVTLQGSAQLVQQWRRVLHRLDIDWEEPLNNLVGDLAGHPLAQGLRGLAGKMHRDTRNLPVYLADYLTDELQLLVGHDEAELLFDDISQLRSASDRLEARLQRLRQTLDRGDTAGDTGSARDNNQDGTQDNDPDNNRDYSARDNATP